MQACTFYMKILVFTRCLPSRVPLRPGSKIWISCKLSTAYEPAICGESVRQTSLCLEYAFCIFRDMATRSSGNVVQYGGRDALIYRTLAVGIPGPEGAKMIISPLLNLAFAPKSAFAWNT
jgi:hypothetical protein